MNVTAAAFVPMTPLFFRHLSGLVDPVAELRDAAVAAVRTACEGADQVLVLCPVGGREAPGDWHDPSRARPATGAPCSLAQQVGTHLLELARVEVPAHVLECTDGDGDLDDAVEALPTALLVLGDGAAARSQAAPGHIDDRSFAYDDAVDHALGSGDTGALAALAKAGEAADLLVTGRHTWPVAAALLSRPRHARLQHRSDPFGLSYVVATWRA